MFKSILQKILALLVVFSLVNSGVAAATENRGGHRVETGSHQQVNGIDIYFGVVPAQIAGKHPATHEERTMHGGVPTGKDEYHLIVHTQDPGTHADRGNHEFRQLFPAARGRNLSHRNRNTPLVETQA